MKIGMIGIGDIAKKAYLPILSNLKDVELHVYTRNPDTLKEIADTYTIPHTYQQMDEWLSCGMKAAFVHTATVAHEPIIDALLDMGIHVYVDKPITYHAESAQRLLNKAKEKRLLLMTGFNRRHAPSYQKLMEAEDTNMIIVQKHRGHQAVDARTFVFDDFIHVIDTILYLFPETIENMTVSGKGEYDLLHHVTLQLESPNVTALGIMNREAGTSLERVDVMNQEQTLTVSNVRDVSVHKNKDVWHQGENDWESMLKKRGFETITTTFLAFVEQDIIPEYMYEQAWETHQMAEDVVRHLTVHK